MTRLGQRKWTECRDIGVITTDECQPQNRRDWPYPGCRYGLILGADDGCWHVEGYETDSDPSIHEVHERISQKHVMKIPIIRSIGIKIVNPLF
jgi:hypothetical protein